MTIYLPSLDLNVNGSKSRLKVGYFFASADPLFISSSIVLIFHSLSLLHTLPLSLPSSISIKYTYSHFFSFSLSLSHSLTDPYSIYLSSFFYLHFCLCLLPTDRGMVPLFPLNHTHTHCHSFSMSKTSFLFIWFSFSYVSILQILSYFVGSLQTLLTASFKLRLTRFTQRNKNMLFSFDVKCSWPT